MKLEEILGNEILNKWKICNWGVVEADEPLTIDHYKKWIREGKHGPLKYLADERAEQRSSIKNFFPEFEQALVLAFDYSEVNKSLKEFYKSIDSNGLRVSSYVLGFDGVDYHWVIKERLHHLASILNEQYPGFDFAIGVDMHPVLDRDLAYQAGIGWFGKNSMLINRDHGSYFMIGTLFINQKIFYRPRAREVDHCGQCRLCIDHCPTDAIVENERTIVASKCLSTLTIEMFKDDVKWPTGSLNGQGEIFGCDICQDVCPWNKRPIRQGLATINPFQTEEAKTIKKWFLTKQLKDIIEELEQMSNKAFVRLFRGTPLSRTGRVGLLKNLKLWRS